MCRTLSYKGAEFEVVEVPLEAKMQVWCVFFFSFVFLVGGGGMMIGKMWFLVHTGSE